MATERDRGMLLLFDGEPSPDEMLDMVKTLKQEFKKLETRKCERAVENCDAVETLQPKQMQRKMNCNLKRRHTEMASNGIQQTTMEYDAQEIHYEPTAACALPTVKVRRTVATTMQQAQSDTKKERALDSRLRRVLKSKQKDTTSDVGSTSSNDSGIHLGSVSEETAGRFVNVSAPGTENRAVCSSASANQSEDNRWLPQIWNAVRRQVEPVHRKLPPPVTSHVGVAAEWGYRIPDEKLYVALDCEFVGVGPKGSRSALGRCSVVDYQGMTLCDVYARPEEPITDYRTRWSGIRPRHMKNAIPLENARRIVKKILKNKIVVGHSVANDFGVLGIEHPANMVRDTCTYTPLHQMAASDKNNPPRSLKKLSAALLGRTIQSGPHSSLEDAVATLDLFKLVQYEWEAVLAGIPAPQQTASAATSRRQRTVSETSLENAYLKDDYWPCDL